MVFYVRGGRRVRHRFAIIAHNSKFLNYLRKLSCFYDTATLYEITQLSFRIQNYVIICVNCEGEHFVVKFIKLRKILILKLINNFLYEKT